MRVGTWNLEKALPTGERGRLQSRLMEAAACDVWLLTEVDVRVAVSGHALAGSVPTTQTERRQCWSAVTSRWPMRGSTRHPRRARPRAHRHSPGFGLSGLLGDALARSGSLVAWGSRRAAAGQIRPDARCSRRMHQVCVPPHRRPLCRLGWGLQPSPGWVREGRIRDRSYPALCRVRGNVTATGHRRACSSRPRDQEHRSHRRAQGLGQWASHHGCRRYLTVGRRAITPCIS
jgi:hypothetical protein